MKYVTECGSLYEVDHANNRIRRLSGLKDPTPRQGKDGEWKNFHAIYTTMENRFLIDWNGEGKCTYTSPIIRTLEESN